ncbi:GNAT family N-acetyltransferase [Aeromonas schubertii]|uniref:GNAT family N-acetyltransferase n=1 Tax=Aeromonas schubertii TaxID=652 RepID=UPI0038B5C1A7
MRIRRAQQGDEAALTRLRLALFVEEGDLASAGEDPALTRVLADYFAQTLADGACLHWVADAQGEVVGAGSLALFCRPPYPGNLTGREGYLLNMFVLPAWRRRGVARALVSAIQEEAAGLALGKVWLHASPMGEPRYRAQGFAGHPAYLEWRPQVLS